MVNTLAKLKRSFWVDKIWAWEVDNWEGLLITLIKSRSQISRIAPEGSSLWEVDWLVGTGYWVSMLGKYGG